MLQKNCILGHGNKSSCCYHAEGCSKWERKRNNVKHFTSAEMIFKYYQLTMSYNPTKCYLVLQSFPAISCSVFMANNKQMLTSKKSFFCALQKKPCNKILSCSPRGIFLKVSFILTLRLKGLLFTANCLQVPH